MSDDKKSFTVKDRRHFTPEGEAREEGAKPEAPSPAPPPPEEDRPKKDRRPFTPENEAREEGATPEAPPGPTRPTPEEDHPIDFAGFILSLGAQAGVLLSTAQEPGEEGRSPLREARSLISILEMLKDKSEGRRTEQETQVIEGVLYELRMAYIERTRAK
jgi:hypothetical protein